MDRLTQFAIHALQSPPCKYLPWAPQAAPFLKPEILEAPINLTEGQTLENKCYIVGDNFKGTTWQCAIFVNLAKNVTIRNVVLIGHRGWWLERWNDPNDSYGKGIDGRMAGIKIQTCPGLIIDRVRVEGFPRNGIIAHGVDNAIIQDVTVTRCLQGVSLGNPVPNPRVRVSRVYTRDLWGPAEGHWPGIAGKPSGLRPGEFIGSDGFVAEKISDSLIEDCYFLGEQYASLKVVGADRVDIVRCVGVSAMVDGGTWASPLVTFRDCVWDKQLGYGAQSSAGQNLQISTRQGLPAVVYATGCAFRGGNGTGGDGVQVYGEGAAATIVDSEFSGINGMTGINPSCAAQAVAGATLNADFLKVNRFENQQRLLRTA